MPRIFSGCIVAFAIAGIVLGLHCHSDIGAADDPTTSQPSPISFSAADWPWWRGPERNGIANADQLPPITWSETENVLWKVAIPGRGHGSPTVFGEQVVLATADMDRQVQSVLCFDRKSGTQLWEAVVHQGGLTTKGNQKASLASSTVAGDGERFFINFLNNDAVWTTALDRNGNKLWQQKITDYVLHQGYGSSPAPFQHLVIVSADNKGGGAVAGLNRATGEVVWKRERPAKPNYPSPIILNVDGKDQLFLTGCDLVTCLDPLTGELIWEIEGATTECVTSTVTDGRHIYTSGGYPKNHISAVATDGSGQVVWENPTRSYVPSMLHKDGMLFAVLDAGIATCLNSSTGQELWKGRLNGTFSSSPVLVGDLIYATNEDGTTFLFKVSDQQLEVVGQNQLGSSVFATPTICGSRIYMRVALQQGETRQEMLYCLGTTD